MRKLDVAKIVSGNARIMLLGTLLGWPLQYAYINQYLPLYITSPQVGISKQFYGILCSLTSAVIVVGAIVSGGLAVRFKPKWVLTCGDSSAFVLCSILWLFASVKRPGFAVAAALCAGAWGFHTASFQLLMTHRQNRETLPRMYALYSITALGVGLLSPLGGLLLRHFDLITLTRTLLCVNAMLTLCAIIFRRLTLEEYIPVKQSSQRPTLELGKTIVILRGENRNLLALFSVVFINGFCTIVRVNYANIYYTAGLGISKAAISILPAISSVAAILATLFLSPHFRTSRSTKLFRISFLLLLFSDTGAALAPHGFLPLLCVTVVCASLGGFILQSVAIATIMGISKPVNWPYLVGLNVLFSSLGGIVSGPIVGRLFEMWPRAPFTMSSVLTLGSLAILLRSNFSPRLERDQQTHTVLESL